LTDSENYRIIQSAEANKLMITEAYLKLEMIRSLSNNTKIYFGPAIHSLFIDWMEKLNLGLK